MPAVCQSLSCKPSAVSHRGPVAQHQGARLLSRHRTDNGRCDHRIIAGGFRPGLLPPTGRQGLQHYTHPSPTSVLHPNPRKKEKKPLTINDL